MRRFALGVNTKELYDYRGNGRIDGEREACRGGLGASVCVWWVDVGGVSSCLMGTVVCN